MDLLGTVLSESPDYVQGFVNGQPVVVPVGAALGGRGLPVIGGSAALNALAAVFGSAPVDLGPWWTQPATFDGNPRSDGTIASIGTSKDRVAQIAGMPDRLVLSGTSRVGGNVQWGTGSVSDPNYSGHATDTVYTATPTNVESSASAWLKFRDQTDGTQTVAMGRITKYPDGRLRIAQYLDDALVSSAPRTQMFLGSLVNLQGYWRIYCSVAFGDATTPFPAYAAGKDAVLFFQLKGSASQPVISLVVQYDSATSTTLKVTVNIKTTNSGQVQTIATITGLAKATRHDFMLDGYLDWGSSGYWGVWCNGVLVATYSGNTLMSDLADNVQPMYGIYRYQYSAKAPDDCALIFHLAGVKNAPARLSLT